MAYDLSQVISGGDVQPPRIIIYSQHGLGKTTFASQSDKPIFIFTEEGQGTLHLDKFPICETYANVMGWINTLLSSDHEWETLVIDSMDWLERFIWAHIVERSDKQSIKSIEDFGYGKGYVFAADVMMATLAKLDELRRKKGMSVILTAHAKVVSFDDPTNEAYDRFTIDLHKSTCNLVQEWADIVLFAQRDVVVSTSEDKVKPGKKTKRARGTRVSMHTEGSPAFDAKNRFGLPDKLPLSWEAFSEALNECER